MATRTRWEIEGDAHYCILRTMHSASTPADLADLFHSPLGRLFGIRRTCQVRHDMTKAFDMRAGIKVSRTTAWYSGFQARHVMTRGSLTTVMWRTRASHREEEKGKSEHDMTKDITWMIRIAQDCEKSGILLSEKSS